MCIVVSWRATSVVKLAFLCEVWSLVLSVLIIQSGDTPSSLPIARGTLMVVATGLLLLSGSRARCLAGALCLAAAFSHAHWSLAVDGTRRMWQIRLRDACHVGIHQTSPELSLLMVESVTGLGVEEVINNTLVAIGRHETTLAALRDAGLRPKMGGLRRPAQGDEICRMALSHSTLGSLPELVVAGHLLGGAALLLEVLVAAKLWIEDSPTNQQFNRMRSSDSRTGGAG